MSTPHLAHAQSLLRFIDESPSPYHVAQNAHRLLLDAGFAALTPGAAPTGAGRFSRVEDGSILAWVVPKDVRPDTPFRLVGAHTDSPNLRLKPTPNADVVGFRRLGIEIYGGVLLNSWLDRDLGLSGRVSVRSSTGSETRLLHVDRPIARLPQLAIHLDREISTSGLNLNRQAHMGPITGLAEGSPLALDLVADELDISTDDILGFDLMLHDVTPSAVIGATNEFVSAPRLDNQLSCHAAITALSGMQHADVISVAVLFDHEEVGSTSSTGAASGLLNRVLSQITESIGGTSSDHSAALQDSLFVSADNAHATHPNYPERHDPMHPIFMNAGPVLKFNTNQRYTTDAVSAATFTLAAERAGVETQSFVSKSDMPCGSTIGPTVAASLGVRALDVGVAQLAMHSARELAGANDPWDFTLLLAELLRA